MNHVTIFSKDNCPQCVEAELALKELDCEVEVLKLEKDFTPDELYELFPTARSFPQFTVNGVPVCGIDKVIELVI